MSENIKEKSGLRIVLESLFSSSDKEQSDIERQVKKIQDCEDKKNVENLLKLVETPVYVKKARFSDKNIKAKLDDRNLGKIKERIEQEEINKQDEKSLDEK